MEILNLRQGRLNPLGMVGGIFISDRRIGEIIEIKTQKHSYSFVVTDAERGEGILAGDNPNQNVPKKFVLEGSYTSGSLIVGFINHKMRLLFAGSEKDLILSSIKSFQVYENKQKAKELIEKAEKNERAVA